MDGTTAAPPVTPDLTLDELLAAFDGDREIVHEIGAMFVERAPALVEALRARIVAGDGPGAARSAHTLKGVVGYFDRGAIYRAAEAVERIAPTDPTSAHMAFEGLEEGVAGLCETVNAHLLRA
jgi:HPt (histidine-containing phosphotransfer) domain-containing protein